MKKILEKNGYHTEEATGIWTRKGYGGISYSDGDAIEERIANIIDNANDVSVLSGELRRHITDWPTRYHLSGTRSNILRPFGKLLKGASVLEVGAGCGAITRYLGECGAHVLALEGSPRRAGIARSRTRDLKNVEVLAENFQDFNPEDQFDFITLIGVLEYANLFIQGEVPAKSMLIRAMELLRPDGQILIAIENQLGLKYFAGAKEDHIGKEMYGIEGRYVDNEPHTYGRRELEEILRGAGFGYAEFFTPFPDYKFPVSIVSERGFECERFDAVAFAEQTVKRDVQLPETLAFSPELVWPTVIKNGLAIDLANSFLISAKRSIPVQMPAILAYHYSTERRAEYCKEARFEEEDSGEIFVISSLLDESTKQNQTGMQLKFILAEREQYTLGKPLAKKLNTILARDGWKISEVGSFLKEYLEIIKILIAKNNNIIEFNNDSLIPGEYFDIIPHNIISKNDGGWVIIDREWEYFDKLPLGFLIFRTLIQPLNSLSRFGESSDLGIVTRRDFFISAFKAAGFEASDELMNSYATMETLINGEIVLNKVTEELVWNPNFPLQTDNLYSLARYFQRKGLKYQDIMSDNIVFKSNLLRIKNSFMWRLTAPVRWILEKTLPNYKNY
jgi:2-polyprenyl-3-methyl-5-hydroxy-6-metoxy-1,4-benzoquinol methylase